MVSRTGRRARPAPIVLKPKRARRLSLWLFGSAIVALAVLFVLFFNNLPFGQGYFVIRYSPIAGWRLSRLLPLLVVATLGWAAVWALSHRERAHRAVGHVMLALAFIVAGVWVWWAPPEPMNQHAFNMQSFSTDGAFVFEASQINSIRRYLHDFNDVTLHKTVVKMGGTRVLSNPPLTTVISYAARRAWGAASPESPGWLELLLIDEQQVKPEHAIDLANGLRVSFIFCGLWALSGIAAYLLGRLMLSPAGAAVFAIVVTFNPCAVHYMPGKDPAQLLTINLALWAWLAAWQRRSPALAVLGGAILTIGAAAGLIHIWVGLVAFAATFWQSMRDRNLRPLLFNTFAAGVGALVICALAYVTLDWNVPRTLLDVSRSWTAIQSTFDMNHAVWYAIGLPMFLLFLSPGFWAMLGLTIRRPRLGFGMRLTICTIVVMLIIYGPLGVTYELPRLWIAFLPTLALGLAIDRPIFRGKRPHARAIHAMILIVIAQFAFTAIHWTLFDARESEFRLSSNRFYD